jgi:hypothetical protein
VPFDILLAHALRSARDPKASSPAPEPRNGNRLFEAEELGLGDRMVALLAPFGATLTQRFEVGRWVLVPAGPGVGDSRSNAMDERLGGYPARPDASQAVALAVSGRASQDAAVIEVTSDAIVWHRGVRSDGTDVSPPIRFPFPSPK